MTEQKWKVNHRIRAFGSITVVTTTEKSEKKNMSDSS